MADVSQGEFNRAVRGGAVAIGLVPNVEYFVLGMSSSAHAAVRDVHRKSAVVARSDLAGKLARFLLQGGGAAAAAQNYLDCLDQYIAWDGQALSAAAMPGKGEPITFSSGNVVRARYDVAIEVQPGNYEARVLLWDELGLDPRSAELIALPVLSRMDGDFGAGTTSAVQVWQLATGQQQSVAPAAAQARSSDVASLLQTL